MSEWNKGLEEIVVRKALEEYRESPAYKAAMERELEAYKEELERGDE